jgi:hypothetical protein
MQSSGNFNAIMAVAVLYAANASSAGPLEAEWLRLVKAELSPACAVELSKVGTVVAGNNGYRNEQWFVRTCNGVFEYLVTYYPHSAFPGRASPFEVKRVVARAPGAEP